MGTLRSKVGLPEAFVLDVCSIVGLRDPSLSAIWFSCTGASGGLLSAVGAPPAIWWLTIMLSPGEMLLRGDGEEVGVLSSKSESTFCRTD